MSGPGSIPLSRPQSVLARATALAYLHAGRPDLERACAFLKDFGLIELERDGAGRGQVRYFRGTGRQPCIYKISKTTLPRFIGFGLTVADAAGFAALAKRFDVPVQANTDPGGGQILRIPDPDGHCLDILHGQTAAAALPARAALRHNAPCERVRINATQRPPLAPPEVTKLGHIVLQTPHFARNLQWYMENFGLIPSDVLCLPDGTPAGAFMRLDRGAEPADHHTIFISIGAAAGIEHAAFEVADLDAVAMGQQVLQARGYRHSWGVGRHLLGSQIFDYWRDPWGMKHEHYADGDLFDADQPPGYHLLDRQGLYQWGPDLPADFVDPGLTPGVVARLLWQALRGRVALGPLLAAGRSLRAPGRPWQKH